MRYALILLLLCSCSFLEDYEKRIKQTESLDVKSKTDTKGDTSFIGNPTDRIDIHSSGNAGAITINLGPKSPVKYSGKTDIKTNDSISQSFSIDSYVKSVSLLGWILILVFLVILACLALYWLKCTVSGRASDAMVAKGLALTGEGIDRLHEKLSKADPRSEVHTELQSELNYLISQKADLMEGKRSNRKFTWKV